MKFSKGSSVPLLALSAVTVVAQTEDSLFSKRMVKRGIDAEGNFNMCMFAWQMAGIQLTHVT